MARRVTSAFAGGVGWGVGLGLALGLTGAFGGGLRPLAKGLMKAGLAVQQRANAIAAEATEVAQDLYHEARDERAVEKDARDEREDLGASSPEVFLIPAEE